jgi:protein-disulfide isomerase
MSSRVQEKARARQRREENEAAARRSTERRRALFRLAVISTLALVAVAAAVALTRPEPSAPVAAADVSARFAGIEQRATALGDPAAPATLTEFADLQCPFCAEYSREVLPTLIERYVRTGKLRMELNVLTFVGDDSLRAGKVAAGAAKQNKLWDFADAFYANQGQENTGYATDAFLRETGDAAGLDVDAALKADSRHFLSGAQAAAEKAGVQSTPSFLLRANGQEKPVTPKALTVDAFTAALDEALAR